MARARKTFEGVLGDADIFAPVFAVQQAQRGQLLFQLTARARAFADRPIPYRAYVQKRRTQQFEHEGLLGGYQDLITSPASSFERTGELPRAEGAPPPSDKTG